MPLRVREVIQLLERNGWKELRSKGSHRHFKHPDRPNLVTVPGNPGKELALGTLDAILKELDDPRISERAGRLIDQDSSASMEKKKRQGYF